MTIKKGLAAVILATAALAACGSEKANEAEEEQVVKEEIDLSSEAEQFRTFAIEQMEPFITDAEMLAGFVKGGELEEAQKLYPLVRMYYERLQPMKASLAELDAQIDTPITAGKEEEATGFRRLEFGLFEQKKTAGYEAVAEELAANIKKLNEELPSVALDGQQLLDNTESMLAQVIDEQLADKEVSYAGAQIYEVKANTEAVEEIVKIFMTRADSEQAAAVTEKVEELNEIIAYYEIGKEDYVNYSLFTSTQKEELVDALSAVQHALKKMIESIK
jgi:iron uptake system component EfeO